MLKSEPQRLKPRWFMVVSGAAEAAPFQNGCVLGFSGDLNRSYVKERNLSG
jgi:hypothetical protein